MYSKDVDQAECVGVETRSPALAEGAFEMSEEANDKSSNDPTGFWQRRQMCLMSKHGFPRTRTKGPSRVQGLRTGDQVCAVVPKGSKAGTYLGRVAIRARGSFNVTTRWGLITDIAARFCCRLQMRDGYLYQKGGRDFLPTA